MVAKAGLFALVDGSERGRIEMVLEEITHKKQERES